MPRALVSVYDKTGIVDFAQGLIRNGWELVSSGGTSKALIKAGLPCTPVESVTQSPEMLGGRVKTIHPVIEGGILADRANPHHMADLDTHGITPIDLVVCNLYPFSRCPSVELIDVGGPTMVRSAAKNFASVGIVVDPSDYQIVLEELEKFGQLSEQTRHRLAGKAFAHCASYDAAISNWFAKQLMGVSPLPATHHVGLRLAHAGRYGENPHQNGGLYRSDGAASWWDDAEQLGGKAMSYLNFYDTAAAWKLVNRFNGRPAVVIVKHANPCGVALANDVTQAYRLAHQCDPDSAFGGIVAVNQTVPPSLAADLKRVFTEVIIASGYTPEALAYLQDHKPNLRIFVAPPPAIEEYEVRSVSGGVLVQTPDPMDVNRDHWRVVSQVQPTPKQWQDLELAYLVAAAASSNCIALVNDGQAVGIGAGQQNRRDAARIAAQKAAGRAKGGAGASEAFFPFRDGLDSVVEAGVGAIVEPGGSKRDDEVIAAANEHQVALVFTGQRHFRH